MSTPPDASATLVLGDRWVDVGTGRVETFDGAVLALSGVEQRLLRALAARSGEVVGADALLHEVWGRDEGGDARVLHTTVARLRRKLEARPDEPQVVLSAYGAGYRLRATPAGTSRVVCPRGRLFGRDAELALLDATLAGGRRLVVITGPAGCGKTRLALEHRARAAPAAPVADLAGARDRPGVLAAVARATGVVLGGPFPEERLAHALGACPDELLVLDDAEAVVDDVRELVTGWLGAAPSLRVLVTSRRALDVDGEQRLPLEPLDPGTTAARGPAVELFLDRARQVRPSYAAAPGADAVLVEIARALDGLPLALELAARRASVLEPEPLRDALRDRGLDLLAGRAGADRHASLRSAIAWSWELLDERSRDVLAAAAVLPGAFDLPAIEATADEAGPAVLDLVHGLVDQSMLSRLEGGGFRLLEGVRAFVLEQVPAGRRDALEARLGRWLAARWDLDRAYPFDRPGGAALRAWTGVSLEALVAACRSACHREDAAVAAPAASACAAWLLRQGPVAWGVELVDAALALPLPPAARGRLLLDRALLLDTLSRPEDAERDLRRAAVSDAGASVRAVARIHLVRLLGPQGRVDEARDLLRSAERLARDDATVLAVCAGQRASLELFATGDVELFLADQERAAERHRAAGTPRFEAVALLNLGGARRMRGDLAGAGRAYGRALELFVAEGDRANAGIARASLASLDELRGDDAAAVGAYADALADLRRAGDRRWAAVAQGQLLLARWRLRPGPRGTPLGGDVRAELEAVIATLEACGDPRLAAALLASTAEVDLHAGDVARARVTLRDARERLGSVRDPVIEGVIEASEALAELLDGGDDAGRLGAALEALERHGAGDVARRMRGRAG